MGAETRSNTIEIESINRVFDMIEAKGHTPPLTEAQALEHLMQKRAQEEADQERVRRAKKFIETYVGKMQARARKTGQKLALEISDQPQCHLDGSQHVGEEIPTINLKSPDSAGVLYDIRQTEREKVIIQASPCGGLFEVTESARVQVKMGDIINSAGPLVDRYLPISEPQAAGEVNQE